jgi:LysM repeat protein
VSDGAGNSWGARVVAPLAFFAAATILVLLVHSSLNSGSDDEPPAANERASGPANGGNEDGAGTGRGNQAGAQNPQGQPQQRRRFYRIKGGDTLESIAPQFDTTVDDLLQLNPGIDPNALTPGQRIRVP